MKDSKQGQDAIAGRSRSYCAVVAAPFAHVGIVTLGDTIVAIDYLPPQQPEVAPANPLAREVCGQLRAYLRDAKHEFDLPYAALGTRFQQSVWRAIVRIPSGSTRTYGELAALVGSGPRAVGGACGSNPIPLVIPCHRVVAADGKLGGFMHARSTFSLGVKRWLLAHEAR